MSHLMAKAGELIFVDSNVFMFGFLESATTEKEKLEARKAKLFFEQFGKQGATFGLSIISLAEILSGIKIEDQQKWLLRIKENFIIAPFNEKATLKVASIFQEKFSGLKNKYHGGRTILNGDIKILGSLLAFDGISRYVTTDTRFHSWAKSHLKAELLPDPPPEQGTLELKA